MDAFFLPQFFTPPPHKKKITFHQPPSLSAHLSNHCSDKILTYPSTLEVHTLNAGARFMAYPKL